MATSISLAPIAPPVWAPMIPPNVIAGAKQAKKRNRTLAALLAFSPSAKSRNQSGSRRRRSASTPPNGARLHAIPSGTSSPTRGGGGASRRM